jgi:U3 small nucleolar RNA-associated protein 18
VVEEKNCMSRVKEKVRKSSAGADLSAFEEKVAFGPDQGHNKSSDHGAPPKDETEERLEKLLFGDDEGFHEALRYHGGHQMADIAMMSGDEDVSGDDEDGKDEEEMDDVADADVSGTSRE